MLTVSSAPVISHPLRGVRGADYFSEQDRPSVALSPSRPSVLVSRIVTSDFGLLFVIVLLLPSSTRVPTIYQVPWLDYRYAVGCGACSCARYRYVCVLRTQSRRRKCRNQWRLTMGWHSLFGNFFGLPHSGSGL